MGYGVWGSCDYGGVCLFLCWQFQESNLFYWGMRMLLFVNIVCEKDTWKCGAKLEKIYGFQIWDRMKWVFRKWLWVETYVLWNQLIWVLTKVGWYIDKKTTNMENGAFDPSPCEKFVMCIMVYKLFDILTFLPMQH